MRHDVNPLNDNLSYRAPRELELADFINSLAISVG